MLEKKKLRLIKNLGNQVRNRVKELNSGVLEYELCWNYNLAGGCLMASYMLCYVLRNHGIKSVLIQGQFKNDYHWWITVDDCVIDITATQFGKFPKVYTTENDTRYKRSKTKPGRYALWPRRLHPPQFRKYFTDIVC